jgi:flavin-dependent dehydrogenase
MRYDHIIVGSGIAGLYAALLAREHGSVLIPTLTPTRPRDAATVERSPLSPRERGWG